MQNLKPYIHKVQYYETDQMKITHHSNYIRFMEEARVDYLEQLGIGYDRLEKEGLFSPVLGVTFEYKKTTTFADEIEIVVSVLELTRVRLKLGYAFACAGQEVGVGTSSHCFLNAQGRPVNFKKEHMEVYETLSACLQENTQ